MIKTLMNKRLAWFVLMLAGMPAHAQEASFDVFEYRVEGTTLLPVVVVEQAVYPHLGEKKTLSDVEKAREALEKAYHGAGYLTVLVSIPQQKVDGGLVKLAVTEAPVDRLRVVESRYFSLGEIRAAAPELAEGTVPNFPQMQKELAALNRSGDRKITPVLRPGKTPGTVEVDLKVQDQLPLHGNVELNDRYSQDTTRTRLSASLRWDNLWQKQHGLGITVQTAPENTDESRVFSASYTWPLASGNYLALYGVKSDSDVAAVGTLNVVGSGLIAGARYIVPLRSRSENFFHTATLGADYKDFDQSVALVDSGNFSSPITYLPFTLGWDGSWLGRVESGRGRTTKAGVAFNFHLRGLVADEQEFADKRYKGRPDYSYLRGTFSHEESWMSGWGAEVRGGWQIAAQPLISNEQYAIGGTDTVRGYLESAALGDNGVSLSLEARTPNHARKVTESLDELHLLAFVDGGYVHVRKPITADDRFTLAGAGLGMRLKGWHGVSVGLDWAVALMNLGNTERGDSRAHFRLGYEW
ncbi:MAG: ShlB/FhaC/HecB family hemolysin secretion/activation protein [Gammaproteobacteria bacterium]|nr:ShlB/FhaC/HecB family hemolysin secretion/activation protein [Gammaproteobacteria bacterium]MBU1407223.1 ShlB/FhaC/HecB family hemolysin secretion/activation protein [Gammaproteobacteria bacterium]MBU1531403.1 ShlB/FhaC/HecB family hemolysin secretion/activation protein [Gammaproteobacteria bacterium]